MNEVIKKLVEYLKTKEALADFSARADHALLELSGNNDINQLSLYFSTAELAIIRSVVQRVEDLQAVRARLAAVEVFTIQLGFRPSAFFEFTIQNELMKRINEPCVVNIVTTKGLLGGAVIDYKGKYRDYSLKSAIKMWREKHVSS